MNTEIEVLEDLTRRPGERYFSWIKRLKQNENAKISKLAELDSDIRFFAEKPSIYWSNLCRAAKAYGILLGKWQESKR